MEEELELSQQLIAHEGAVPARGEESKDNDFMTAVWRDGMKKEMAEITVGEFKQREVAQDKKDQNRIGWSQVHPVTKSFPGQAESGQKPVGQFVRAGLPNRAGEDPGVP